MEDETDADITPQMDKNEPNKRQSCKICERPVKVCWCNYLPNPKVTLKSNTSVIIIQHPSEKKRKIRTALMAVHGLDAGDCKIFSRRKVTETDDLSKLLKLSNAYILYPTKDSKNINDVAHNTEHKSLIILDGTWDEAKKIYSRSPVLQRLPTIHLELKNKSEYVVRTQPSETCLSTIETVAHSLATLENDPTISERLLKPLHMLCKFQLAHGAVEHDNKSYKRVKIDTSLSGDIPEDIT